MTTNNNNIAAKKYLKTKKQLRVWMDADKYEKFQTLLKRENRSVYAAINEFVSDYIEKAGE